MSLKGRVAIVTGSTSGIGLGIAKALARDGADVVLNGLGSAADIEAAVAAVAAFGSRVSHDGANMLAGDQVVAMVARTEAALGRVDIVVNNAGIQHVSPIEKFPVEKWDQVIAINLTSSFHTIRAAVPGMKARNHGRIINICSAHSLTASPFKSAYVAAKHGLAGLTKCVALELAETGITCNAISPGFVWTPLVERQIPDIARSEGISETDAKRKVLQRQPTRQFITIDEVADLAAFLARDEARSITGANYSIDGGWTAE
jgi:3-hydroxybutyrate dehydrogenase